MPKPRTVHLLCNSHLDPVWLWEWPEGAGEALALTRTVCDLCEAFDGFVFNRNEVQFHEWIAEHDPALFDRVRRLAARGQWHVMGGWYLQPDCNLPSGESFVRQMLVGRRYFRRTFGVEPTVAVNFDSFGHSRGLVQILRKSGYDAYLFCRPKPSEASLPGAEFVWVGFDGSEVTAAVAESHYNSAPRDAANKIREWMQRDAAKAVCQVPWGVGNHGGGPSRLDLEDIARLMAATPDAQIVHSTPERYFADLRSRGRALPRHDADLNPWAVGCYTSMMRLKRMHRRLENELYLTEKMATTAWAQGLLAYPVDELTEATRALLACEFHDILPGSATPSVEEGALAELGHGLTLVQRVKGRSFFALAAGQAPGRPDTFPILVYNPHPFPLTAAVECEIQPAWPDRPDRFGAPIVMHGRRRLPAQAEKEESNINEDHRKRVVFLARLEPGRMNRFDCRLDKVATRPAPSLRAQGGQLRFRTADLDVVISTRTGLIDRYRVGGEDYLAAAAAAPLVMQDNANPWAMDVTSFRKRAGRFRLMTHRDAARFAGVDAPRLPPVRVIEDGAVRVVVEALFRYGHSAICQRYRLPRAGAGLEIETRVSWQERDHMLKLSFPTAWTRGAFRGQVVYGAQELPGNGDEAVAQKWVAVLAHGGARALTAINDTTYGCDFVDGELRLSLLRAPAHAAHPSDLGTPLLRADRLTPRIDQGEHVFHFRIEGGPARERLTVVDREALAFNERPYALSHWPSGAGEQPDAGPILGDRALQVTAFKRAEEGDDAIVRLFEPTGRPRTTTLRIPCLGARTQVRLGRFELKTLRFDRRRRRFRDVSLLEE